jgi:hypothetical protein
LICAGSKIAYEVTSFGGGDLHVSPDGVTTYHVRGLSVASIVAFRNDFVSWLPPDGTLYFKLGPDIRFGTGSINVSAIAYDGVGVVGGLADQFIQVIQMAVRTVADGSAPQGYAHYLDIVVRNNAHAGGPGTGFSHFALFTSIIYP